MFLASPWCWRARGSRLTESMLGKAGIKNRKSHLARPPAQPPKCPECTSQRVWKDGTRYTRHGDVQRYLCRNCGYRFSDPKVKAHITAQRLKMPNSGKNHVQTSVFRSNSPLKKTPEQGSLFFGKDVRSHSSSPHGSVTEPLNNLRCYNSKHQVCVTETQGAKNLVKQVPQQKRAAGATVDIKSKIVEYSFWLLKQGYGESTALPRVYIIKRLVSLGVDLWSPESVKEILANQKWGDGYKKNIVYAYENFMQMEELEWKRPKYRQPESFPFIPTEAELDQLIASCGKKVGTFLQRLKDTGADPGELATLTWIEVNKETRTVNIHPVKGHNPRVLGVSVDFLNRLEKLPKKSE